MPRAATPPYAYSLPAVYLAVPGTTILVDQHNTPLEDIAATFNTAQPIQYGGTGATTVAGAQAALGIIPSDRYSYPTATGTGDAIVVTNTSPLLALTAGAQASFTASAANTTAVTINVDGLGAKAGRKIVGGTDVALAANDLLTADKYSWVYSTTANAAAGGWIMATANTTQRNAPPGTAALPAFSFDADQNSGFYNVGADEVGLSLNGALAYDFKVAAQLGPDGTVSLPGYSFILDPNTGIYRIGADNIGVAANGAKVLDIGTAGLGITGGVSGTAVANQANVTTGTSSTLIVTPAAIAGVNNSAQGSLFGMTLSNDVGTPATVMDISAGSCRDSTNVDTISVATAYTKSMSSVWSLGTGGGFLDTGTSGAATYHIYAIKRTDTQVSDYICSLSNGTSGTITMTVASPCVVSWAGNGLQIGSQIVFSTTGALPTGVVAGTIYYVISAGFSGATSFEISATQGGAAINTSGSQSGVHTGTSNPQLPANYTLFRRIGSLMFSGTVWVLFKQYGDVFVKDVQSLDVSFTANPGTSAVTVTGALPLGLIVLANLSVQLIDTSPTANTLMLVTSLAQTDTAPGAGGGTFNLTIRGIAGKSGLPDASVINLDIATNTLAQWRYRLSNSTATISVAAFTAGWTDRRGRLS